MLLLRIAITMSSLQIGQVVFYPLLIVLCSAKTSLILVFTIVVTALISNLKLHELRVLKFNYYKSIKSFFMMKNMMTGIQANKTLKLSHLLIAFFLMMGTFVASYSAKAHSVAVFIEIGTDNRVKFHALTWHRFSNTSGSMRVNGTWYRFVQARTLGNSGVPALSSYRRVASCSGWESYNRNGYTYQSTDWISGINLCASMSFSMTGYYLEEPDCNLSGSVNVSVPVIIQPISFSSGSSVCENTSNSSAISMSIVASGVSLEYTWQRRRSNENSFTNVGSNSSSYSQTATQADNGATFRCIVTSRGSCGVNSVTSNEVRASVLAPTQISTNTPLTLSGCSGSSMSLSVAATGSNLRYQWYRSGSPISGANGSTLQFTADNNSFTNGSTIYCQVIGSCGIPSTINSNTTTLSVTPGTQTSAPSPTTTVCDGGTATIAVNGTGAGLTYQWQVSRNGGGSYSNVSNIILANTVTYTGATTNTLTLSGTRSNLNGALYRCVVSGSCGSPVTSNTSTLVVNSQPVITTQPQNLTVCDGRTGTFTVSATGTSLRYTWQTAGTSTATSWTDVVTNSATSSYSFSPGIADDNKWYRVLVSSGTTPACGATQTSTPVQLTVGTTPAISLPSSSYSVCESGTVSLTLSATGTGITYQWEVNGGSGYQNVSGANYRDFQTNTMTIVGAPASFNNNSYRAVVTGNCGTSSTTAIVLTVNSNPSIVTQPTNQNICIPSAATFSLTAAGYSLTYAWENSINGNTYTPVIDGAGGITYTGANTNSLGISPAPSINQYRYRVKVTGGCGNPVYSDAKILTVNSLPNITVQPVVNTQICVFGAGTISLTDAGLGNTYQWQVSSDAGANFSPLANTTTTTGISHTGVTTASLLLGRVPTTQDGYRYRCVITPNVSCNAGTTTSSTVTLTVNTRPAITIQPVNSNNNTFHLNNFFNSQTTTTYVYRTSATGSYTNPTNDFQWKVSTDGGRNWSNVADETDIDYTVTTSIISNSPTTYRSILSVAMRNGSTPYNNRSTYIYRCFINGICDNVTSNAVKVNPPPKLNRQ
jgi:hypothetical protein